MNSKMLGISLLFCLIGVQAHATKARLTALGQPANGSLFIRDERNIFLNPAQVNSVPNLVNFEAGALDGSAVGTGVLNEPKAEGGVAYHGGSLGWAAQLGHVATATEEMIEQTSTTTKFFDPQNSIQAIIGGRGSVDWGVSLHHASSVDDQTTAGLADSEARTLELRGGVEGERFQAYGTMDLIHESKTTTAGAEVKFDGNMSFEAGGAFAISEKDSIGGSLRKSGYDFDDGTLKGEYEQTILSAAYFYKFRNDETALIYGSGGLLWANGTTDFDLEAATDVKIKQMSLPFAVGCEVNAATWLKLRGSVTQHVFIHNQENIPAASGHKLENLDSTIVTIGTGFVFDKFVIDATLEGSGSAGTGQFNGDHMFANLGATYQF